MDMMTLTEADVLTTRALASAVQTIRRPDESTEEAVARWKASTTKDERAATLSAHRAAIEQAAAEAARARGGRGSGSAGEGARCSAGRR